MLERLHVIGYIGFGDAAAVVQEGAIREQVGDTLEIGFGTDRQLERRDAGAEDVA